MPEEEKTQEVETTTEIEGGEPQLTYEQLQQALKEARREAANRRVKNKELDSELDEFKRWKESQMTELEKAQAKAAQLEQERRLDFLDIAAAKYNLEPDDLEFITGQDKATILSQAEKLATKFGRNETKTEEEPRRDSASPNFFPGTRGRPVGSGAATANDILRAQLGR